MVLNRRSFIRASAATASGLLLKPWNAMAGPAVQADSRIGIHPFVFDNQDAVFIMQTNVDVKTNTTALKEAGLSFGRSVFGLTDDPANGMPLTDKVVLKPNLTCRGKWNNDYTTEGTMGVVTDSNFIFLS